MIGRREVLIFVWINTTQLIGDSDGLVLARFSTSITTNDISITATETPIINTNEYDGMYIQNRLKFSDRLYSKDHFTARRRKKNLS